MREVSKRILLPEGRFCIVPCTFNQGEEGHFLLRVFVEKHWGSSEGGRGHTVNDAMDYGRRQDRPDAGRGLVDDMKNFSLHPSPKPDKPKPRGL